MLRALLEGALRSAAVALALGTAGTAFAAAERPDALLGPGPLMAPASGESWLGGVFERRRRFRLDPASMSPLLERYERPWENHTPEWRAFFRGRYGFQNTPLVTLTWRLGEAFAPSDLPVAFARPCPRWKAPKPLTIARYSDETERLALFDCDGGIAPDVLDRLSTLARAPDSPLPALPLPELPLEGNPGEWVPGVKLLDPRVVWLLGEIQAAFPTHTVVIMSGYRPHAHTSFHQHGKALDLYVQGVPNEELFALCRTLHDVGCGYYPNNRFVHLDVRPFGSAKATWVDISEPGAPSIYVDGWPGVLDPGIAWMGRGGRRGAADQG